MAAKIETRLKKASKTGVLNRVLGTWITNGHMAIHRGLLVSQGLCLPYQKDATPEQRIEADAAYLEGLLGVEFAREPDEAGMRMIQNVLPKNTNNYQSFMSTPFTYTHGHITARLLVAEDGTFAMVQETYLDLLLADTPLLGLKRKGSAFIEDAMVDPDRMFVVMPFSGGREEDMGTKTLDAVRTILAREGQQ